MSEMVDRVAKAIGAPLPDHGRYNDSAAGRDGLLDVIVEYWAEGNGHHPDEYKDAEAWLRDVARAVIGAMREPTHNMVEVGDDRDLDFWRAMIDEALK